MGKILVVDDNECIRAYYGEIFRRNFPDYEFLEADTNERALRLANGGVLRLATDFDIALVITDEKRGNNRQERGSDLARGLRNAGATYPILMVSGYHPDELKQRGMLKTGVSAVLSKVDMVADEKMFVGIVREFLECGTSPTYEEYAKEAS